MQEKIVKDISEVLTYLGIKDHMVIMDNTKHGCMTARGIKNYSCDTRAQRTTGQFRINPKLEDIEPDDNFVETIEVKSGKIIINGTGDTEFSIKQINDDFKSSRNNCWMW